MIDEADRCGRCEFALADDCSAAGECVMRGYAGTALLAAKQPKVLVDTRGPVTTVENLSLDFTPDSLFARTEVFECPHCGKLWQRAIGEGKNAFFSQSRVCRAEGPNDFESESDWKRRGCGGPLPCDLKPGDRVSLEAWDRTEPPRSRLGPCIVVSVENRQNCQSGFMIGLSRPSKNLKRIATLDRAWLAPLR